MNGGLGIDVVDGGAVVVFVDNFCGNFAVENLLEKRLHNTEDSGERAAFFK